MFLKNKYDESCSNLAAAIRKIKGKQRFYCLALNGVQQTSPKIIGKLSCGHIVTKKQNEIQFTEKNPTKYAEFEKKKERKKESRGHQIIAMTQRIYLEHWASVCPELAPDEYETTW